MFRFRALSVDRNRFYGHPFRTRCGVISVVSRCLAPIRLTGSSAACRYSPDLDQMDGTILNRLIYSKTSMAPRLATSAKTRLRRRMGTWRGR